MTEESWLEELSTDKCLHLLGQAIVGRIAVIVDDTPIVLPVNCRLVETSGRTWIALRTRPGNVIDKASKQVAFEIDELDPLHREGWSVLARGTLHHVDETAAGFSERFDPQPWMLAERDAWLVIETFVITGRRLHTAKPEWAFHLDAYL